MSLLHRAVSGMYIQLIQYVIIRNKTHSNGSFFLLHIETMATNLVYYLLFSYKVYYDIE